MRYYSLLVCLLVSLLALPNLTIASVSSTTTAPSSHTAPTVNTAQASPDWYHQQLFTIQSQLARLDEKLQQQTALGSDVKALETTQQAIKVQLANLQTKLEVQEKVQINQLNGFDGRIGDLKDSINMWFFTLTILLALGGYIVYRQSKKEAEDVAGKQMETFIAKNADQILEKAKSSLESKLDELNLVVNGLNEYLIEAREIIYDKQKEVEVAADNTLKAIAAKQELDPDDLRVLENSTKRVDKEHATAQEYLNFAMVSHAHKDYQTAIKFLNLGLGALNESERQTLLNAQLLWNKAITYWQLKNTSAEMCTYDEVIEEFGTKDDEELQGFVAQALFNKGVVLEELGKQEKAIEIYIQLIEQFSGSTIEVVNEHIAKALFNSGNLLSDEAKAIEQFDILINRYSHAENPNIKEHVLKAMLHKGIYLGRIKEYNKANDNYDLMFSCFNRVENQSLRGYVSDSLVNSVEISLLYESKAQTISRIDKVERYTQDRKAHSLMQFIRFLLGDKTINEVFSALTAIPKETELNWKFAEIKEYLTTNFTGEKLQHIQAVVAFFEQHKDIETLRNALGIQR